MSARIVAPLVLGLLVLTGWHLLAASQTIASTFLPSPSDVWKRLTHDLVHGSLLASTAVTLGEAAMGCLIATVIALPLGYLIAGSHLAQAAFFPYLAASQAVPAVALAPLLVIWVGYGIVPIALLCALIVFFPLVLATVLGVRGIDPDVVEAAELDGASGWAMLWSIEAPLARPVLLTGIRNGFTLSVTGAVVGEFVMGGKGLGLLVSVESASADTTGLFATLIVLCTLAVAVHQGLVLVEHLTDPYRLPRSRSRTGALPQQVDTLPLSIPAASRGNATQPEELVA
ncbi:NitT/TauT family transport system permease protein [Propionibacterium cyclohexanicum]|uniref:NitT/TauT family transport system permease protein n=1 Tax=Propionibacterium cyclohexanicum TaxID=64702 RepID=A0A1H9TEZ9_9ACTN|nr:ABC transporter permease [Propionibacterium cyclohexanicum]SER95795.1 NitT/TauT family transport system permease protein [Propionibacterium cyclohexanicum]